MKRCRICQKKLLINNIADCCKSCWNFVYCPYFNWQYIVAGFSKDDSSLFYWDIRKFLN